jgi:hypothetical protein
MTVRFYTHSAKKWAEGIALIDSGATENFMNLNYAQWLGLPIKCLEKPRRLFNVDGTKYRARKLQFYTDVSLQTGTQHTNHYLFLSDLGEVKAIFDYPWFVAMQPKIVSRPGRRDRVIELIFICRTAGLLLTTHDLISSSLPIVVASCFLTFPVPSPSFLSFPSPSGTFCSRLLNVLLASGSLCTLPTCSH